MIERTETMPTGSSLPWPEVLEHLPFNATACCPPSLNNTTVAKC